MDSRSLSSTRSPHAIRAETTKTYPGRMPVFAISLLLIQNPEVMTDDPIYAAAPGIFYVPVEGKGGERVIGTVDLQLFSLN